jgi:hypothetical protein
MDKLPDLERLSVADKDELIRALFAQVTALTAKVAELEGRLSLNSRNSSKPPSTDGMSKPKPKSQRQPGQHPTGGQTGHSGHTLKKAAQPDHTETHRPPARLATPAIAHWMAGRWSKHVRYSIFLPCVTKSLNIR